MKANRYRATLVLLAVGFLVLPSSLLAEQGLSHARVVRLSFVDGTVAIQRPGSTVWASATVNTPLQEGFSLSTSSDSFAEVEFENGSTARLGELSRIDFTQLAMNSDGDKLNHLALEEGYATFHFMPDHGDVYSVKVSDTTLTPRGKAEFRTNFDQGRLQVEVFDGSVEVEGPGGAAKVGKDKVLDYDTQTTQAFSVHEGIQKDDWDKWVEARDQQAVLAFNDGAVGRKSPMYGWSDLDTYGEWANYPGYGNGWTPYVPAGWSPYSLGSWSWYSGYGWTWISADPWGWLPYHCGFWNYDAAYGWFWMGGGCGQWSSALVTWYGGPGWIGWAPAGSQGGGVTAVPPGTVQNGQPVNPGSRIPVPPHRPKPISGPPFSPSQLAMQGGEPLPPHVVLPGQAAGPRVPGGGTSGIGRPHSTPAPPSVLMGGDPKAERAQLAVHQSLLGRAAHALGAPAPHPVYAHLGTTLGGRLPVTQRSGGPATGFSRGPDRIGGSLGNHSSGGNAPRGSGGSGPVLLSHGSAGGSSHGGGSTGGGYSGSAHSSGGGSVSSGSSSVSASSSSSSGSSGGHSGGGGGGGSGHH